MAFGGHKTKYVKVHHIRQMTTTWFHTREIHFFQNELFSSCCLSNYWQIDRHTQYLIIANLTYTMPLILSHLVTVILTNTPQPSSFKIWTTRDAAPILHKVFVAVSTLLVVANVCSLGIKDSERGRHAFDLFMRNIHLFYILLYMQLLNEMHVLLCNILSWPRWTWYIINKPLNSWDNDLERLWNSIY